MECSEGEHAEDWCHTKSCSGQGEMEANAPLVFLYFGIIEFTCDLNFMCIYNQGVSLCLISLKASFL